MAKVVTPKYLRHLGISVKDMVEAGIPLDSCGNVEISTDDHVRIACALVHKRKGRANG